MARPDVDKLETQILATRVVQLTELARMILETNDVPEGEIRQKARDLLRRGDGRG